MRTPRTGWITSVAVLLLAAPAAAGDLTVRAPTDLRLELGIVATDESPPPGDAEEPPSPALREPTSHIGNTEWFTVRFTGGNYGGGLKLSFFTLRWTWFYWSILNLEGAGGNNGGNERFNMGYLGKGGTMLGLPIHFGEGGRHEFRFGAGVSGGIVELNVYRTWWNTTKTWFCTSHGPFLDIEGLYQFHILRHLAIQIGYQASIVFLEAKDNGHPNDGWMPRHVHMAFVGLAI